jgi:hypothetical protein
MKIPLDPPATFPPLKKGAGGFSLKKARQGFHCLRIDVRAILIRLESICNSFDGHFGVDTKKIVA